MQDQGNQLMRSTQLHCTFHLFAKMNNGIESLIMLIERSLKQKPLVIMIVQEKTLCKTSKSKFN